MRLGFRNFRLVCEFRFPEGTTHSGIALWGRQYEYKGEPCSYQGHLVVLPKDYGIFELYRRGWSTGSVSGNWLVKDSGRGLAAGSQRSWNRVEILARDGRLQVAINGIQTVDMREDAAVVDALCRRAPVALQLHWTEADAPPQRVQWRGLRISEDPVAGLVTLATSPPAAMPGRAPSSSPAPARAAAS